MVGNPLDYARGRIITIRFENGVEEFRTGGTCGNARAIPAPGNPLARVLRQVFDWESNPIGQKLAPRRKVCRHIQRHKQLRGWQQQSYPTSRQNYRSTTQSPPPTSPPSGNCSTNAASLPTTSSTTGCTRRRRERWLKDGGVN